MKKSLAPCGTDAFSISRRIASRVTTMAYRPPQYQYAHTTTTTPHAPHMVVTGTNTTVAYPGHGGVGTVHGDGVIHPNVDGVYVTENYVGPVSTILGCVLLGPFLCPLVFLCPVRATRRRGDEATRCATRRTRTDD